MRLLQAVHSAEGNSGFSLVEFLHNIPPYAILSHTWGADHEEVNYKDIIKGKDHQGENKPGYLKLWFCAAQAHVDGLEYFWVDTCCIDKSSSAELSEAINSMFSWYQRAAKCYVFMTDVPGGPHGWRDFTRSRWFTRGWTLQELVAPRSVEFFSANAGRLGDRESLLTEIVRVTGIPHLVFRGCPLSLFDVEERMSWAEGRQTKREEDAAYSLLGLFDVHMPLIYGEGRTKAFARLRREIADLAEDSRHADDPLFRFVRNQFTRRYLPITETAWHAQQQRIHMVFTLVLWFLGVFLLLGSTCILLLLRGRSLQVQVWTAGVCGIFFATSVKFLTSAKRSEVFAATTAYAAVLFVFLQNSNERET